MMKKNLIPENEKTKYQFTDKGTVTEIYIDDYTLDVTVVEINYYLGEVTTVKDDDDGTYVSVRALSDEAQESGRPHFLHLRLRGGMTMLSSPWTSTRTRTSTSAS